MYNTDNSYFDMNNIEEVTEIFTSSKQVSFPG